MAEIKLGNGVVAIQEKSNELIKILKRGAEESDLNRALNIIKEKRIDLIIHKDLPEEFLNYISRFDSDDFNIIIKVLQKKHIEQKSKKSKEIEHL